MCKRTIHKKRRNFIMVILNGHKEIPESKSKINLFKE